MARRPAEKSYGYESCRFEKAVDENFHCSICYNVLKEPRTCINNDHMFCLECITEHLKVNPQNCPQCNEYLSVVTLRRPRVVNNYLSELKIKCDYASRGCPELVRVADLKSHVENCGFAPVLCSNEECGMEINKQDKVHHETEVCEYRKVKCHECGEIKEALRRFKGYLLVLNEKIEAVKVMNQKFDRKVDKSTEEVDALKDSLNEVKEDQKRFKNQVTYVKEIVETVKEDQQEVKKEINDVKENISKVNKDVNEVKVMMSQVLEKLNMLELLNKQASPTEGIMNTRREDILISGCWPGKSTEIYSWEENCWFMVSAMNEEHRSASSFIYEEQLFVVGGELSKTIETLDFNELPLKWMKFPGELPYECDDHQTVVYQQRVIHFGGYNYDEERRSNVISELRLSSPCTMNELCQMPEPRGCHGAEIFEDKVLILGGENGLDNDALDSVLEFDVRSNECKEMPPLPHALKRMATVRWRDKVVMLGGLNERREVLNDVLMYDCKTGKVTALPAMLDKRFRCCAVITGNTIVVMGGMNEDYDTLNSVECFTMGGSVWEYLPPMNEARLGAIAEILPSTSIYV